MCLLAVRHEDGVLTQEQIESAYYQNSDGFGVAFVDGGRVVVNKTMGGPSDIAALIKDAGKRKLFLHWRWATHGDTNLDNIHPYDVITPEDGVEGINHLVLGHNGVLSDIGNPFDPTMSDTYHLAQFYVRPLLKLYPAHLGKPEFKKYMESLVPRGNKVVLFGPDYLEIIREYEGHWKDGTWFSNTSYQPVSVSRWASSYSNWWKNQKNWDDDYMPVVRNGNKAYVAEKSDGTVVYHYPHTKSEVGKEVVPFDHGKNVVVNDTKPYAKDDTDDEEGLMTYLTRNKIDDDEEDNPPGIFQFLAWDYTSALEYIIQHPENTLDFLYDVIDTLDSTKSDLITMQSKIDELEETLAWYTDYSLGRGE